MSRKFILFIFFTLSAFAQSNFEKAALKFMFHDERDQEAALKLCKKACEEDQVAAACYIVAKKQEEGYMPQEDTGQIFKLYQKACDMGDMDACKAIGDIYNEGRGGVATDHKKAREIYEKVCEAGLGDACFEFGHFYKLDKDFKNAVRLYEFACQNDSPYGCYMLAQMYEGSKSGIKKDLKRSLVFFMQACDGGIYEACEDSDRISKIIGGNRR
ncbi:tetratricopeptide repeat protein [Campylobacter sp. CCUG 57310]|uniref:tetratricopeptide repeat protein n=1 Tax=Campylobacter sp. CCUG 57310 TaxID=2517362 RepID=UPI00156542B9|nr:tetratricopeptide repeat protein [Campylobacter sp. CCUG 57310]QKF91969.1 Sel1 domain-containing protein [Campylobacter sp. CCUG 57310]